MAQASATTEHQGFDNPVLDAQACFRVVMNALARPGSIRQLPVVCAPPQPLAATTGALLLTLADFETALWLDDSLARDEAVTGWIRFHCGAPIVDDPAVATFAVATGPQHLPALSAFSTGSADYPDRSTTLILQVKSMSGEPGVGLTGPGIETAAHLNPNPLPPTFWQDAAHNNTLYPRGIDIVFAAPTRIAALPRSTRIAAED